MFWRFGGYANISTLDTILDKPDVTLEELLDESDLIQELKQHNTKLIEYLRDENVLRRLLEYVIAPVPPLPDDNGDEEGEETTFIERALSPVRKSKEQKEKSKKLEEREEREKAEKIRSKYAYIAAEVLSSETWSILEALMENQQHLRVFWDFLKREPPLDMTTAGHFTKINEALMDKKTEETLEFIKSLDGVIPAMLQHVDCPMVMDLLLKIISMEKHEGGQGIVDWLQSQNLIPLLLAYLSGDHPPATQTSAGDFIKAIITISANASQNEQSCIGPNNLTRQLVSEACIESLVSDMLRGGNPLTVGVGIIIEVIRKNNSDYDPDVGAGADSAPSSNDPIYLGTLLRLFAKHVPDFTELILSPTHTVASGDITMTIKRKELNVAFKGEIEPLGFDRFKTCELMAELLHCSNMGLLNERGSEAFVRRRDEERERLKAEGVLTATREPRSETTEFSEDSNGMQNGTSSSLPLGSGSPDELRKLEVANSADEDGFEDVGASADLGDIKDDFDDKSPFEIHSEPSQLIKRTAQTRPRLDLDEDFVDEPLTSPRLEALDEKESEVPETTESLEVPEPEPVSPTSGLTSGVSDLTLDNDTVMTHEESSHIEGNLDSTLESAPAAQSEPASDGSNGDAPPLPHRDRHLEPIDPNSSGDISPLSDDKPAPLFASRSEPASHGGETSLRLTQHGTGSGDSQETIDTTIGEEGDSSRSVLMSGNEQSFAPHVENDIDGQPIVGDFLKMMFVEHRVVPTILDFFFRFPWNNFLHNVVYDVVQQVFNGPMDRGYNRSLAIDLFETGRITERIVDGQQRSDETQAKNNMRLGYMGHLTLIAEEVVKFSERHPTELLSQAVLDRVTSKPWSEYVENTLSETRERDNAILGGVRPDMSVGPRQAVLNAVNAAHGFGNSGSSALANAGLHGGGSTGLDSMDLANGGSLSSGTFGLNSGSLSSSGFGSSSDEEDEEMEEVEDDGTTGVASDQLSYTYTPASLSLSAFTTSPTTTTSHPNPLNSQANLISSDPSTLHPSDPSSSISPSAPIPIPLPPPLTVAPSRARRQLAARLALHSKNASLTSSTNPSTSASIAEVSAQADDAILSQRSETPFGDLADLNLAASPELEGEGFGETEEGHDVPVVMGEGLLSGGEVGGRGRQRGLGTRAGPGKWTGGEGDGEESSDSSLSSGEEEGGEGVGRVREARVRSLIEDEEEEEEEEGDDEVEGSV